MRFNQALLQDLEASNVDARVGHDPDLEEGGHMVLTPSEYCVKDPLPAHNLTGIGVVANSAMYTVCTPLNYEHICFQVIIEFAVDGKFMINES